jgi:hypothetical protein
MHRLLSVLCLLAVVAYAGPSLAQRGILKIHHESNAAHGYGTKIDGLAISTARWTGWVNTGSMRSVAFDILFTDANSSVTSVTMVCESSTASSTANDSGYDLHVLYDSATEGTSTSVPHIWSYTTGGTKRWNWTVTNVPSEWLNCKFYYSGGTPAAADVITVVARGITP